jgi:ubiquinone/menaquinone biosynthesis C-methylase UbiE
MQPDCERIAREEAVVAHLKFDIAKLEKLNDPARFESLPPGVFWQALGSPTGARVIIEMGAGTGVFASAFAAMAPEAVIYAADTSPEMIDWMRANRPEVAAGRIVPIEVGETCVPLDAGIADALYMINLHHELAHPDASYAEAHRLLKPGGRILVVDWADRDTPQGPPREVRVHADVLASMLKHAGFLGVAVDSTALPWHSMATATR